MRRNRKIFIAAVMILSVSLAGVLFVFGSARVEDAESPKGWGKGNISAVERTYYLGQLSEITDRWRRTSRSQMRSNRSHPEEFFDYFLVIDMDKGAIWIERDGQIVPGYYSELAPKMGWMLYRVTSQAMTILKGRTHFKFRGRKADLFYPEKFYLAGRGRGLGHLHFSFRNGGTGMSYGSGKEKIPLVKSTASRKDMYKSMVVDPNEYEQYLARVASKVKVEQDEKSLSVFERNLINWRKVQKRFYWEINRQVHLEGFEIRNIEVKTGPDFGAGHVVINAEREGILSHFFGGARRVHLFLKFDYLGSDTWYVKSGAHPNHQQPNDSGVDLEFLVFGSDKVSEDSHKALLEKGRLVQKTVNTFQSKWRAIFENGTIVEFIGVCEHPSAGKKWWGPDGNYIEYVPYCNAEIYDQIPGNQKAFVIAWRMTRAADSKNQSWTHMVEGSTIGRSKWLRDRYGFRPNAKDVLYADACTFDEEREKMTLKIGFKDDSGEYDWISFKNISLVPGKDFGCEVLKGEQ